MTLPIRSTRSQRALGWIICRQIAEQMNARNGELSDVDVHDLVLADRYGVNQATGEPAKTFAKLTKKEMGLMIDHMIRWAADMDIPISIPADRSYFSLAQDYVNGTR